MSLSFMDGNEAIARAAIIAGCQFFAGYPITPATTIYQHMLNLLPPAGGYCLQGEDEIASIGFCLGASMAGMKSMTATSGPGISLMSEQLSFAVGSEIPIVVVDVQRLGPSTGSATKGADGDIQFLRWGNSGGQPVIVLAPVDVGDSYVLTMHAFNLAEQYRCPVFIATNKEIAMTRESVDLSGLDLPQVAGRSYCPPNQPFLPFQVPEDQWAPCFLPIGGDRVVRQTSSTHGEDGYITLDQRQIRKNQERLRNKLTLNVGNFSYYEVDAVDRPQIMVIAYGVSARAARAAVQLLRRQGKQVSLLVLKTIWPVPGEVIRRFASGTRKLVVVEMNLGQYAREIQRVTGRNDLTFCGQMDGHLISPQQIAEAVLS